MRFTLMSILLLFLSACATIGESKYSHIDYGSIQKNTSTQFLYARIGNFTSEDEMNKVTGFQKAYFYTKDKGDIHFYPWWITADFTENKLMKNVILHFPIKVHFAGLHESVIQIKIPSVDYRSIPMIMHKWVNTFKPIVIQNQAVPVISASIRHESLVIKLDLPSSLFFNNLNYFNGLCEFKDKNFVLKNGVCRYLKGNDIYVNYGNLMMGIENGTRYGIVRFESEVDFPSFPDYDFGEVLIWDNEFIIYGENFDAIIRIK